MMKKLNIYYSEEFYELFGKHALMNPGTVKLGDIINYDTFDVVGSLSDLGIDYTEEEQFDMPDVEPIYKSQGIRMGTLSAGQEKVAKFGLTFSTDNSLFLSTKGSKVLRIVEDNIGSNNLGSQVIAKYNQGKWERNWIVVTEVECAKKAIIILSNGKNAEIELKTDSNLPLAIGEMINANLSFGSESSIGFRYVMPEGEYRSVLFKAKGIDESFFRGTRFISRDFPSPETVPSPFEVSNEPNYLTEFMWK